MDKNQVLQQIKELKNEQRPNSITAQRMGGILENITQEAVFGDKVVVKTLGEWLAPNVRNQVFANGYIGVIRGREVRLFVGNGSAKVLDHLKKQFLLLARRYKGVDRYVRQITGMSDTILFDYFDGESEYQTLREDLFEEAEITIQANDLAPFSVAPIFIQPVSHPENIHFSLCSLIPDTASDSFCSMMMFQNGELKVVPAYASMTGVSIVFDSSYSYSITLRLSAGRMDCFVDLNC